MPVWEGGRLLEVTSMDKPMDTRIVKGLRLNDFTEEKRGGIYLVLGSPSQVGRQLQPKQGAAQPQLV